MKIYFVSLIVGLSGLCIGCKAPSVFQIECYSVSTDASYIVDVTIESKKAYTDLSTVKLNAIDGVLFRGITGNNCITQKPMINKSRSEIASNELIQSIYGARKGYEKYITGINNAGMGQVAGSRVPITQLRYRVTINKDLLRKDLVSAGLVKSLQSGF